MKFVDEATIHVKAGKGGDGCMSFLREKFVPRGGPNGGDGGFGGSIYIVGDRGLNTLVDYRHKRLFRGQNGEQGGSKECTGASGEDMFVAVPIGTLIYDDNTDELIGDITEAGQQMLVAKGGIRGLGNARFKSSVNRAPRQTTKGKLGDERDLRMELKLLADVGLLGMPNAGKSTLISKVSSAKPKVADYPFTTLHPNLGVVSLAPHRSFVMADIPGLIEGAAEGHGLGVQFLKHLSRTGLLLHVLDINPIDESDPVENANAIIHELEKFNAELVNKERWLILNKTDTLIEPELSERCDAIVQGLAWQGPVYRVSAISGDGLSTLCEDIYQHCQRQLDES
tara:strand:+ start:11375 stop:12394 length:1020 start_codon:yes stop_codon:yes gene_type:complete